MAAIDDLVAQVERIDSVADSAITLLNELKAKLDAAGTDPAKLKALSDLLGKNTDELAAAITANTPSEPTEPTA